MNTFNLIKEIKELEAQGYIRGARHSSLPLTIYNYTPKAQFEHKWNDITMQCRGLVLDDKGNVVIRCVPKFFNATEPEAAKLGETKYCMEKLDGYYISCKKDTEYGLIVTSRGSFDNKYVDAAKSLLRDSKIEEKLQDGVSYFMELTQDFPGDEGLIVMRYDTPSLTCWAANRDGIELDLEEIAEQGIPVVNTFTEDEYKSHMSKNVEGVVIKDVFNNMVKIKTEWYLNTHRVISNCTKRNVFDMLRGGAHIAGNSTIAYKERSGEEKVIFASDIPEEFFSQMVDWEKEMLESYEYAKGVSKHYYELTLKDTDKDVALNFIIPKFYKSVVFNLRKNKPIDYLLWDYVERHCLL